MKIGICIHQLAFRTDLEQLVNELGGDHDICLFLNPNEAQACQLNFPVRTVTMKNGKRWALYQCLFFLFGKIPKSRSNYYLTQESKLSYLRGRQYVLRRLLLRLTKVVPKCLSYDFFSNLVASEDNTATEDIDAFIFFTEMLPASFWGKVKRGRKPCVLYVYSWDHPCKHNNIPRVGISHYYTWNQEVKEDLVQLQGIAREKVSEVGATQMARVKSYIDTRERREGHRHEGGYIYFGCSVGVPSMVYQELMVINILAESIRRAAPGLKLLVRPYPLLRDQSVYGEIGKRADIGLDETVFKGEGEIDHQAKYKKLEEAVAFFHLGTTLGLECAYLDTPCFLLALEDVTFRGKQQRRGSIGEFVRRYHVRRYLMLSGFRNVVRTRRQLENVLGEITEGGEDFLRYNRRIAGTIELRELGDIGKSLVAKL